MERDRLRRPVLALFRMVTGLLFPLHGTSSHFGVFGGARGTGIAVEFAVWPSWWAALIQLVCGALVLTGLFTRSSAVMASGSTACAYFAVHQPQGLLPVTNGGELAAVAAGRSCSSPCWDRATGPWARPCGACVPRTRPSPLRPERA
ncbi:DoxX family protein [Streptomonospora algeriensis]|uniref:DoxX family protein n=1 Tax=Streptomonospora algeriensis TaxID=995084 RepID=A0ABW3BHL9_9ACTN